MSCLLFESEFYESGEEISKRIIRLVGEVKPEIVSEIAIEARSDGNLRHVPLLLARTLAQVASGPIIGNTIASVIQRADELAEFLALYWKDKADAPLDHQVKRGLRMAITKFDEYQLAKYDRRDAAVKLRDVLRIIRPKPANDAQSALWRRAVKGELATPDTWEAALTSGANKKETFERLIREGKLGYFALLRNLRGMAAAGVDTGLIKEAIVTRKGGADRILPFRFVAAARACPQFERELDRALVAGIDRMAPWSGLTAVLVDVSSSMDVVLASRGKGGIRRGKPGEPAPDPLKRVDAAAALASMIPGDVRVFSFSNSLVEVPPRRGMAGVDAILRSQHHSGTQLIDAVRTVNAKVKYDRIVVISDEQAASDTGRLPAPNKGAKGYVINVASAQNGIGYGPWVHLDGFSEAILRWITAAEASGLSLD